MINLQNKKKREFKKRKRFKLNGHLSIADIYRSGKIYWAKTLTPIKCYLNAYNHILKPVRFGKKRSGRGVYVSKENLNKFIRMYENNELKKYKQKEVQIHSQTTDINESEKNFGPERYLNMLEVYKSGEIFWVKTYDAIRKYIQDPRYIHIFKPFRFGKTNPPRKGIYVSERNLKRFINLFKNGEL